MTTARDIMSTGVECAKETDTLVDAARRLRDLDVGSMPICGQDGKLKGMLTDRDIVVKCIAEGGDPMTMTAGDLAQGKPFWVSADAKLDDAIAVMKEHQVRRVPVIEDHKLVGIISQADVARMESNREAGSLVKGISAR